MYVRHMILLGAMILDIYFYFYQILTGFKKFMTIAKRLKLVTGFII